MFAGEFDDELRVTTPARHLQCVQTLPKHQQHLYNQDMGHHRTQQQQIHPHQQQHIENEEPQTTSQQQALSTEHDLIGIVRD